MTRQFHGVVEDSQDFDAIADRTVHEKVTGTSAVPCNMQGAQAGQDLVARLAAKYIWARLQLANGGKDQRPVVPRLGNAVPPRFPAKDIDDISLRLSAELRPPIPGHRLLPFRFLGKRGICRFLDVAGQVVERIEGTGVATLDGRSAGTGRRTQGLQLDGIFRVTLLDEAQPLAQYLARVLIAAGPNQTIDDFLMMLSEHDVSSRHRR